MMKTFLNTPHLLFAHRGGNRKFPENTIPAFQHASKLGAINAFELDVRLTADRHLVVFHDPDVGRVTEAQGLVKQMNHSELQKLNAGYHFQNSAAQFPFRDQPVTIPLLSDLFDIFPRMKFNIELKDNDPQAVIRLWDLIQQKHIQEQVLAGSFNHSMLSYFRQISKGTVATSASKREVRNFYFFRKMKISHIFSWPMVALQLPVRYKQILLASQNFIDSIHAHGLAVHFWTVNKADEIKHLFELGADGVMSDDPELLVQVYRKWQESRNSDNTGKIDP